jgi:bifunctional UDP-N-acetylglucosamine pyrophosphorylase/glucosamine-1-phosphate N-acetyltransferase
VLHPAAGRPLLCYPVRVAERLGVRRVVVVVSPESEAAIGAMLAQAFPGLDIVTRVQREARGTGDAARVGCAAVDTARTMILYGDTPLVRPADVAELDEALSDDACPLAFLSAVVGEPHGYGRVLRDALGRVTMIREHRDLEGPAELAVNEVNAGVYVADTAELVGALARLSPQNAQGEYYLTDVVSDLARERPVVAVKGDPDALVGVNDRAQLRQAEQLLWARKATELGRSGVTIRGDEL